MGGASANQYPSEVAPKPPPWQQVSYRMSGASLLEYRSGSMHIAKRCIIPTECNKIHEEVSTIQKKKTKASSPYQSSPPILVPHPASHRSEPHTTYQTTYEVSTTSHLDFNERIHTMSKTEKIILGHIALNGGSLNIQKPQQPAHHHLRPASQHLKPSSPPPQT